MIKPNIKITIIICCFNILFNAFSDPSELIKNAWNDYELGDLSNALQYFIKAEKEVLTQGATNKVFCEILTGQAFCYQYKKFDLTTESDYFKAITLYEKALKRNPKEKKIIIFLNNMINECNYRISEITYDEELRQDVNNNWNEIIQNKTNNTILIQDTLLSKVLLQSDDYLSQQCLDNALLLEDYIKQNNNTNERSSMLLTPAMAHYLSDMWFHRNDYKKTFNWIVKYCEFGPTSHKWRNFGYFMAANIAEKRLFDKELAIKYYSILAQEKGFYEHAYFAEQKIKELSK